MTLSPRQRRWAVLGAVALAASAAAWLALRGAGGPFFREASLAGDADEARPFPPIEADLPGQFQLAGPEAAKKRLPEARSVTVYFENAEDGDWVTEERSIMRADTVAAEARQALAELIAGPRARGHLPSLPEGTRLLNLLVSLDGTAFADFSRELADPGALGGCDTELRAVGAVVRTLTENFPVSRVHILVEGAQRETLHGHFPLAGALRAGRVITESPAP